MSVTESSGNGYALYNGVKLPNIDSVWTDKESYPYALVAYIADPAGNGSTFDYLVTVCFVDKPLVFTYLEDIPGFESSDGSDFNSQLFAFTNTEALGSPTNEWFLADSGSQGNMGNFPAVWSSYDITNATDQSVYLFATSPIPLDGMTVIEWDGDTTGLTEAANGLSVLISEKIPNINKPAYQSAVLVEDGLRYYGSAEKATESEGNYYWYNFLWHTYVPTATDNYATPGIWSVKNLMSYALFAFYEGEATEETTFDLKSWLIGYALGLSGKPLPIKVPVAYLYAHVARDGETPTHTIDGVGYVGADLPALPVEDVNWDVETYPYVFIYRFNSNTILICSSVRSFFSYNREEAGEFGFSAPYRLYKLENDSFVYLRESVAGSASGNTEDKLQLIWANHDVLKDDGSVYMAAGYTDYPDAPPVPAEVVVADPCPDKSVMYLYDNGATEDAGDTVTLPAVPEVDLSIYPYLSLSIYSSNISGIALSATRHPLPYDSYSYSSRPYGMVWRLYNGDSEWTLVYTNQGADVNVWANYDVYDTDGNLKIAASVPTPIYE